MISKIKGNLRSMKKEKVICLRPYRTLSVDSVIYLYLCLIEKLKSIMYDTREKHSNKIGNKIVGKERVDFLQRYWKEKEN
jgi:hypothetical protein